MRKIEQTLLAALCLGLAGAGAALAQPPAAAPAPAGAAIAAGMSVKDTSGGDVGTVTKVEPGFVTVKTDKHEARLPAASFTPHQGILVFAMTRDQLNAEIEKALAAAQTKIAAGAAVSDASGGAVGTITAVDAQWVTVKLVSGTEVRLPRSAVSAGPSGALVGNTAAQLEAAAKANAPAAAPAAPAAQTPPH
jgi:preprotein translocase subunit YajC